MPKLNDVEPAHPRFRVCAYLCASGVKNTTMEGWAVFGDIYVQAPDDCRYVVVEAANGEFLAFEFNPVLGASIAFNKDPPPAKWRGKVVDAVVMKAMALYGR